MKPSVKIYIVINQDSCMSQTGMSYSAHQDFDHDIPSRNQKNKNCPTQSYTCTL